MVCHLVLFTVYTEALSTMFVFFLPVIQSVSDAHVVGKLFPQGSLQLTLSLDGLQGLA